MPPYESACPSRPMTKQLESDAIWWLLPIPVMGLLPDDVFEVIKKSEYFFCLERILIFVFDAGDFVRDTPVHVFGRYFINMAV